MDKTLIKLGLKDRLAFLDEHIVSRFPTGSRVICNPPVMDTDEDWCVLYNQGNYGKLLDVLESHDYYPTGKFYNKTTKFVTFRHRTNDINLICTRHPDWYERFEEATFIAKTENIMDKNERVELFEMILGNRRAEYRIADYNQINRHTSTGPQYVTITWPRASTTGTSTIFR